MTDLLKNPIFLDETDARDWLEARVWPNGRVCPHCGNADQEKITKLEGKAHRPGVYQCNESACREQFTVTVNTVFERSKIPLTKWLAALFLMTASKKGVSAHQVHRMLGISYKSTWFLMHRLREAMRRWPASPDGRPPVLALVELPIGRQVRLGANPEHSIAAMDDHGGVVDAVVVAERRTDHKDREAGRPRPPRCGPGVRPRRRRAAHPASRCPRWSSRKA